MTEEFVTLSDATRLWTDVAGCGIPIVILNGGPGMPDYLAPVANLLDPQHYRVHRYEQRGCGRSSRVGVATLARWIADIEALRIHWQLPNWIVIGHSWGADLGLAYAIHHPESVIGLAAIAGGRVHNDRHWHKIYNENKHKEQIPASASEPNFEVNRELNDEWKAYCRNPQLLVDIAAIDVPAVFLWGEHDIRPSWPTEQICQLINGDFVTIENCDHNVWQGNPRGLSAALNRFLDRCTANNL